MADPAGLDYDSVRQFVLTVQVTDSGGLTASAPVTVYVNDLNEPPIVASPIPDQQTQANRPFTFTFDADAFRDPDDGDVGALAIVVTARDSGGLGVSDTFVLTVLPGNSWHNQSHPYDVNGDGEVTPIDVLALINYLISERQGSQR